MEKETKNSCLLVSFPKTSNGKACQLKSVAGNSNHVSLLDVKNPVTGAVTAAFKGLLLQEAEVRIWSLVLNLAILKWDTAILTAVSIVKLNICLLGQFLISFFLFFLSF